MLRARRTIKAHDEVVSTVVQLLVHAHRLWQEKRAPVRDAAHDAAGREDLGGCGFGDSAVGMGGQRQAGVRDGCGRAGLGWAGLWGLTLALRPGCRGVPDGLSVLGCVRFVGRAATHYPDELVQHCAGGCSP